MISSRDFDSKIRPALRPIGHSPSLNVRQQPPQQRIVVAGNDHSIEGHAVHELEKSFFYVPHVAVAVHVLAIDVGHDRQDRRQLQERTITLVGLSHQVLRLSQAGIRSHGVDAAANYDSGIEATRGQHCGHHGCCCGFAVHAGDGNAVLQAHQFGQHLRTLNDRDVHVVRFGDFGIFRGNRGTGDNDLSPRDVFSAMSFKDGCAEARQPLGHGGTFQIGAGNLVAKIEQHLGNAAHANAADTYEMNTLNFGKHKSKAGHGFTLINAALRGSKNAVPAICRLCPRQSPRRGSLL